jgi:lipoprotein-anchoring transpeptidase ErfK/SrfK
MFLKKKSLSLAGTRVTGVVGLRVAAVVLSACSSGDRTGSPSGGAPAQSGGKQAAPDVAVTIDPAGGTNVNPMMPITVTAANGKLVDVTVTNATKGKTVAGTLAGDGLSWVSTEALGYGTTYKVLAHAVSSNGNPVEHQSQLTTLTPKQQANANLIPAPSSVASTGVGVGQPIVFSFGQSVKNKAAVEKQLTAESTPKQDGGWFWIDDKNVHYRPKEYWQAGHRSESHRQDLPNRFWQTGFSGPRIAPKPTRCTIPGSQMDGSTDQMQIFHNGQMVKSMPISLGKDATPTHLGPHVISFKDPNYTMDSCTYGVCQGQPGYYRSVEKWSTRISNDGEFVHENPNSVGAQGSSNVSHGCIILNSANAQWFFQNLGLGDVVEVTNSGGPQLPVWDLYGDWSQNWAQWKAGSAINK